MSHRTPTPEFETDEDYLSRRRNRAGDGMASSHWQDAGDWRVNKHEALQIVARMGPILYAVQYEDGTVKIGYTADLPRRLRNLHQEGAIYGHGRGYRMLAIRFGTRDDEQALHRSIGERHRVHGVEWYKPNPEVLDSLSGWLRPGYQAAC